MILQRYIGLSLVKGWLLVLVVLGAVFGLISFTEELGRTNENYNALDIARYTLFILPNQLVSLAPVIALLGSIVALANLDRFNELTVISCTGFKPSQLVAAILMPTLIFMALLLLCMEFITPQLQQSGERERHQLRYGNSVLIPGGGVWSTDGRRYIHLRKIFEGNIPGSISLFEFNEQGQLSRALHADSAQVRADRSWLFQAVREKVLIDGNFATQNHEQLEIGNLWSPDELPTLTLRSDSMSLSVLYQYSQYLAGNNQPMQRHINTFWQKLLMPLTVCAMVMLATPISASVTAGRDRSFGVNIGIGAVVGIIFYLGAQIIFALGQLLSLNVPLVAALPALIIMTCAAYMFRKMHW